MISLPIDSENQRTGRKAAAIVAAFLEQLDLVVRSEAQETDFGSDLELELHDGPSVSGRVVKCQVKGTAGPAFARSATRHASIKASTQNYWASLPVNVICILCDVSDSSLYWQPTSSTLVTTEYTSVRFTKAMRFDDDAQGFLEAVARLARTPTSSQILSLVPACLDVYTELAGWGEAAYDRGFEAPPEVDGPVRLFYDHLERLCIYTGIDALPVPWKLWERRNSIIQDSLDSAGAGSLDGNLASEVLQYVRVFYERALCRVAECVNAEDVIESNPSLASLLMSGALRQDVIRDAFNQSRSGGIFSLDVNSHHFFRLIPSPDDLAFDARLQGLNVARYSVGRPVAGT